MCARGPTTRHHNWLGPSRRTPSPPPHPRFIFSLAHLRHMPRPSRPCVCNLAPGPENGRWQHAPCFSSLCPATAHSSFKAKEESGLFSDPLQASCLRHPIPPRLCSPRLYTKLDHKSTHTRVEQHAPTNLVLSVPKTWHKQSRCLSNACGNDHRWGIYKQVQSWAITATAPKPLGTVAGSI